MIHPVGTCPLKALEWPMDLKRLSRGKLCYQVSIFFQNKYLYLLLENLKQLKILEILAWLRIMITQYEFGQAIGCFTL